MTHSMGGARSALARIASGIDAEGKPIKATKSIKPVVFSAGNIWPMHAYSTQVTSTPVSSGGGEGYGSNSNSQKGVGMSPKVKVIMGIFLLICTALSSLSMVYLSVARTSDKGMELQMRELETDRKKYDAEIAKATGAYPSGWSQVGSSGDQVVQVNRNKEIINTEKSFSCTTVEDVENGFAARNIEYINAGTQSLRASAGCVLVVISGTVSKVEGKGYRLSVPEPSKPGSFWNCGDMGGSNDADCTGFVNYWSGKEMRVAVLNRGYVSSN